MKMKIKLEKVYRKLRTNVFDNSRADRVDHENKRTVVLYTMVNMPDIKRRKLTPHLALGSQLGKVSQKCRPARRDGVIVLRKKLRNVRIVAKGNDTRSF